MLTRTLIALTLIITVFSSARSDPQIRILSYEFDEGYDTLICNIFLFEEKFKTYGDIESKNLRIWLNENELEKFGIHSEYKSVPYSFYIILDQSGSMEKDNRYELAIDDISALISSYPNLKSINFVGIHDTIQYYGSRKEAFRKLKTVSPKGNTRLYDGIFEALRKIKKEKPALPIIIAFSDGLDLHSQYIVSDCLNLNNQLNVPVYIFLYNNENIKSYKDLNRLTSLSGGQIIFPFKKNTTNLNILKSAKIHSLRIPIEKKLIKEKWLNIKLQVLLNSQVISAQKEIKPDFNNDFLSAMSEANNRFKNSGVAMLIVIGLAFIIMIIWVVYFARKRSTSKKCPFCGQRYDINLDSCPQCHQNTMFFYETGTSNEPVENMSNIDQVILSESSETLSNTNKNKENDYQVEEQTKVLNQTTPPLAYLVIINGDRKGRELPLFDQINTIGRSADNQICIEDTAISQNHLKIWKNENGALILNDLASTNGTLVNNNPVIQHQLKDKDEIQIGKTRLVFIYIS